MTTSVQLGAYAEGFEAGYEEAKNQAAHLVRKTINCECGGFCECYGRSTLVNVRNDILAMQPKKVKP